MSRTKNSIINIMVSIGGQILVLLVSFISRSIFIKLLSAEYLGINGLFTNMISLISLAELGIGTAIIYSLYRPIAHKNTDKIKILMNFYKKVYMIIGCIVLMIGSILIPFLEYFIKDVQNDTYLKLYFFIYVLNSAFSYFYAYKRSLIIADQHKYISVAYHDIFYFIRNIFQIIILLLTSSYFFYLLIQLIFTCIENILISNKADNMYPYLKEICKGKLDLETSKEIKKNTIAMVGHKIGGIVVNGTDNLLISKFIGIAYVGIYSNYMLIIAAVNSVFTSILSSITASVGNLIATESKENSKFIFYCLNFVVFWIGALFSIILLNILNPFIYIWIGENFLLPFRYVILIVINFYLNIMRRGVLTFRDAFGLYWQDRYKPLIESVINFVVSSILVIKIGMIGVIIGTIVSTLVTCIWIEPYILYRYGFNKSMSPYFIKYFYQLITVIISGVITYLMCEQIMASPVFSIIIRLLICITIPNLVFFIVFCRTDEFKYIIEKIKLMRIKLLEKYKS